MSAKFLNIAVVAIALAAPGAGFAQTNFERFMAVDANRDGAIARQEMEQGRVALFNRADSNRDGSINEAERAAVRGQLQAPAGTTRIDSDGNGVITRDEFMSRPYPVFDRFDADENNVLDANEIATIRARAAELMDYH